MTTSEINFREASTINFREGILSRWTRRAYALVLLLIGAALLAGGVMLAWHGGSIYYLSGGVAVVASGVLVWRGDRRGAGLYGAMLVATLVWAIYEVGFDIWGLVVRLAALFVLGIPFLFRPIRGAGGEATTLRKFAGWPAFGGTLVIALFAGSGLHVIGPAKPVDPLWQRGVAKVPDRLAQPLAAITRGDWLHYGNDQGGARFSPLAEITPSNVDKLEVAWEADVGPATPGPRNSLQVTPINVGDALYVCNGHNVVISLDAETGRERWRYDMTRETAPSGKPCRGVSYYRVPDATGLCAERILAISQAPELFALDASTGRSCPDFGVDGRVRLLDGLGEVPSGYYYVSSAPQIVRGKAVFGGAVADGQYWGEPSGVIRAYDAITGRLAWAFDSGRPQNHGEPPSGETYTLSTPNSWAPISADETLGLVYLPTGNSTPDFYGGQRRPFDDDVASSVIALDAETGQLRWRFQTVHHDIWDYDVPAQPTLIDLPTPTGIRRALIQPTKRGEIFVLDRVTGEPIKAVSEVTVPQGGIAAGERLSPTQPFSTELPSFRGPTLREADMWGLTPIDQMMCRILFKQSRYEGTLTPPTLERPTIVDPGYSGGPNWGSVSVDVDRGIMLVNWMRLPARVELITRTEARDRGFRLFDGSKAQGSGQHPMENTPYASQAGPFLSPLGMPCNAPPWGLVTAVDLTRGQVIWSKRLGTGRDSGPFGIRSHLPVTMGVPNTGGSVTTRGGLVFIGAAVDSMVRAFDTATGEQLWQANLPGAGMATPMTYQSPRSGRQFMVIAAGGRPALNTRLSTKIVAYALPR
jgi:quinoprotein glucose dehydrogenase